MKWTGVLNLRRISGQIAALVVVSVVGLHLVFTASFLIHRPDQPDPSIDRGHAQLAASAQLLGAASATDRPRLLADIVRTFPQLGVEILPPASVTEAIVPDDPGLRSLHRRLGSSYHLFALRDNTDPHRIGIALPDGTLI